MKLANLSFCLVLVGVLSGCFSGTKPQNATPEPQQKSLADLKLKPLKLDAGGRLTAQSAKELRDFAVSKNTEPTIILADSLNDKIIANVYENTKKEFVMVDIENNDILYFTRKPIRDEIKSKFGPNLRPESLDCKRLPRLCKVEDICRKKSDCFTYRLKCDGKDDCLAKLLDDFCENNKCYTVATRCTENCFEKAGIVALKQAEQNATITYKKQQRKAKQ